MVHRKHISVAYSILAALVVSVFMCWAAQAPAKDPPLSTRPTSMPASGPQIAAQTPAPVTVSGTVVDDRTGSPIPEFTVTWGDVGTHAYWQHRDTRPFKEGRFTYELPSFFDQKEYSIQVMAKGYKATASRMIRRTEVDVKLEFRLVPPEKFSAVVRGNDGKPVAGAQVRVVTPGNYFAITSGAPVGAEPLPPGNEKQVAKTDGMGQFDVEVDCERCRVLVLHEAGFADLNATQAARKSGAVALEPWGTIACDVNLSGKPAAGVRISARSLEGTDGSVFEPYVAFDAMATTDAAGRCMITRVRPGKTVVGIFEPLEMGRRDSYWGTRLVRDMPMEAPSGKEVALHIGGGGAEVTGRLTAEGRDVPWKYAIAHIRRAWPEGVAAPPPADWRDNVMMRRDFPVEVNPDGTFRATDIPPGDWRIDAMVFIERKGVERVHHAGDALKRFHIPSIDKGADGAPPVNLGNVPAVFDKELLAGELAPDFDAVTLDGKKLRLSDLRGKYVFIDFWATWCGPCRAEMHYVKESWEKLKNDRDVVILGLSLDATDAPVRPFVAENSYGWTHAVMGENSKVAKDYGITSIPCEWLVLPDGTLAKTSADKLPEQIARHRIDGKSSVH